MTPPPYLVPSLLTKHLKTLAQKCGVATSGTKALLRANIQASLAAPPALQTRTRVLSIDMGIRNLAYCLLDVPSKHNGRVKVLAWDRLAVSSPPAPSAGEGDAVEEKEQFDPKTLSQLAYALLREKLLVEMPSVVLIERQRFRSMGSKHILEWTVRVNVFEAALHGVLAALRGEGGWKGDVWSVGSGRVARFWLDGEEEGGGGQEGGRGGNKGEKIDVVGRWLRGGEEVVLEGEAGDMGKRFLARWEGKRGEVGKLDDLADCLLQGVAWVRWEENKRCLVSKGVEGLGFVDDSKEGQSVKVQRKKKEVDSVAATDATEATAPAEEKDLAVKGKRRKSKQGS